MKKTNKKLDNQICHVLTDACEMAKDEISGFQWLTHLINYNKFPGSLLVICVFDTKASLQLARQEGKDLLIINLIKNELAQLNIRLKDIKRHILFDTEEECEAENNGKWKDRINR